MTTERAFTPALGRLAPTNLYDPVIALTRERLWRSLVAMHAAPRPGETVVDVGCGTGSLALLLHRLQPHARVIGVDPDENVLAIARKKARSDEGGGLASTFDGTPATPVTWLHGMGDALTEALDGVVPDGSADTAVCSLVLHQCPMPMKRAILASMYAVLRPGGRLVLADYGLQRTFTMRQAFRLVQLTDGVADTQPNADGVLPSLMIETGFDAVREAEVVATVTGSISVYVAHRR
ncbi:class I SAM-dependent methyltransferase [Yinghuangia seranimata]|uniref:class I SAM-dependent methyltransferase n=1 Tax=Yinghuangia seranimata TaxID=408067 RepID=UPI00248B3188|nr:class I SAM-dependent methyltransferase [Yinghuangia seranimata]MDI2129083.1 methyltransferase domain-containing protein [Yinghuangia seranimata]